MDLRGYNNSAKPNGIENYNIELIVDDVCEVIEKLGRKAILVGHDWGAVIAWTLAMKRSDLISRLIVMNGTHPSVFMKLLRTRSAQLFKSWYIFMFQCPCLPEILMWIKDYDMFDQLFRGKKTGIINREKNFTDEDLEAWKYAFSKPNALTPPVNYYRALIRQCGTRHLSLSQINVRTLIIWGEKDEFLLYEGARMSLQMCTNGKLKIVPNASHWVQQDCPNEVNLAIQEFLNE